MRLVHLLARGVEQSKGKMADNCLAGLDGKAERCAQMLKTAFKDKIVDVTKAKEAIVKTIQTLVTNAFPSNPGAHASTSCKSALQKLMFGGRLFTDQMEYDMGHRAAGNAEINLMKSFNYLLSCVTKLAKIDPSTFMRDPGQPEVVA